MAKANTIVSSSELLYEKLLFAESVVRMALQASGENDVAWIDVFLPIFSELTHLASEHSHACFRVGPMLAYLQTGVVPEGGV